MRDVIFKGVEKMKEHCKIYSNELYKDAIYGKLQFIKQLNNTGKIELIKQNNNMYILNFYINGCLQFKVCNTIDCLYCLIDGYTKCMYDVINYNIINIGK